MQNIFVKKLYINNAKWLDIIGRENHVIAAKPLRS